MEVVPGQVALEPAIGRMEEHERAELLSRFEHREQLRLVPVGPTDVGSDAGTDHPGHLHDSLELVDGLVRALER